MCKFLCEFLCKIYTSQAILVLKFIQAKIRAVGIYTRLVCGWGENYTSQYKYEACIKRKNYMEGLYKKKERYGRVV